MSWNSHAVATHEAKEFTVIRSKWTGRDSNILVDEHGRRKIHWSGLWNENTGDMCCLGFYGLACGYSKQNMAGRGMPCFGKKINTFFGGVTAGETDGARKAADINDSVTLTQSEKEEQLIALFAEHGITLNFVDE